MTIHEKDQAAIKHYLLGDITAEVRQGFEQSLMTDGELFDQLLAAEDELIDEYLAGMLDKEQAEMFEKHFLATAERQQKLRFAGAFRKFAASHAIENASGDMSEHSAGVASGPASRAIGREPGGWYWQQFFFPSPWRVAAFAVILLIAGVGIWRLFFYQSDIDKGLLALNAAYDQQRPIEARISKLGYAPFVTTRGGDSERIDSLARNRAEAILSNAVIEKRSAAAHHALGEVYLAKKQFDDAIKEFEEALKSDPKNSQVLSDLGAAWLEKGRIDLEKGKAAPTSLDSGKGMEELGRSLENLNQALALNPNLLEALFNRALCAQRLTLYAKAEEDWRQYLQKDSSSKWAEEARRNLKALEDRKNKAAQSEQQLQQDFLDAFNNKDDEKAWAALSHSRARTGNLIVEPLLDDYLKLAAIGRRDEALGKLRKISYAGRLEQDRVGDRFTFDLAKIYGNRSIRDRELLIKARTQMKGANDSYKRGEFDQAGKLYSQASESFARIGDDPEALLAESWIGYSGLRIPKIEESLEIFQRLCREFEARNYRSLFAQALHSLADAESSLSEFSKALDYAHQASKVSQEIEDKSTAVRCLQLDLSMRLVLGDYNRSLRSLIQALNLAEMAPSDPTLIWPLYFQAALDFHYLGLPGSALAFEQEALRLAETARVPLLRSRSLERLGILYGQQKNYSDAIKSGEMALTEAQNIVDVSSRKNVTAHSMLTLGKLRRESGDMRKAIEYFDQSLSLYNELKFDAYFYEAHKGKLLALIALKDDASANLELTTVVNLFDQYRKRITDQSNRDKFFDVGQNTYDVAVDYCFSGRRDPETAFAYAEASRARSLFELMSTGARIAGKSDEPEIKLGWGSKPLSLTEIQTRLPAQTQLLEYAVLDDKVVMWVITQSAINSEATSVSASELEREIRSYTDAVSRPTQTNRDALLQEAKGLHARLISPVEKYLDRDLLLCIVPDKSLNYLPFEALVSETSGHYLIEDYRVERAPSATIFIQSSDKAKAREQVGNERLLAVGNPSFDRAEFSSLPDLPGATREAEQIATYYQDPTSLVGNSATTARVTHALAGADVIHFATHAVVDERSSLLSKLLLAHETATGAAANRTDGVLQVAGIYEMRLPRTRLVVLSACQTGIERTYRGEGAIGLARPFIAAGVPVVIASLWPVDSEATADLMISFHKYRKLDHLPTVESLRRAQLDMINNQQPGSQPNYGWAAFTAIGGYATF